MKTCLSFSQQPKFEALLSKLGEFNESVSMKMAGDQIDRLVQLVKAGMAT